MIIFTNQKTSEIPEIFKRDFEESIGSWESKEIKDVYYIFGGLTLYDFLEYFKNYEFSFEEITTFLNFVKDHFGDDSKITYWTQKCFY